MIPILGVPILTRPDLLENMLASVDVEVGELVVIDNGGVVEQEMIDRVWTKGDVTVVKPGHNLGVATSWNTIIKAKQHVPWWAIVGFDVVFAPGDLQRLTDWMEQAGGVALLGTFSAFGIDHGAIDRAGLFDENFHPAYFEDNDFAHRCRLAGVRLTIMPASLGHHGSQTIRTNPVYARENGRTFPVNREYYKAKWGGEPRHERFQTPFNRGGDIPDWTIDEPRLARQAWRLT